MTKFLFTLTLIAFITACSDPAQDTQNTESAAPQHDINKLTSEALAASKHLGSTLKTELQTAMKAGGPLQALDVCNTRASELTESISQEKGLSIKRVSLKNRNAEMGAPNEWQTTVLNGFEQRKAEGEPLAQLGYAEVVDNEFRFMKAIPTGGVCLKCHGTDITPEITEKLNTLYPEDKATGYKEGDLRGAFVVVKPLN